MRRSVRSLMIAVAVIAIGLGYWASTRSKEARDRQHFIDFCKDRADFYQKRADDINRKYPIIEAAFGPDTDVSRKVRSHADHAAMKADLYRRKGRLDFGALLDAEQQADESGNELRQMGRFDSFLRGQLREAQGIKK